VFPRTSRPAIALFSGATLIATAALTQVAGQAAAASPPPAAGSPAARAGGVIPLKNAAMITKTKRGYRYMAGQQDSHLVVTRVKGGLRFVDTGTADLRARPRMCAERRVKGGIGAVCTVGGKVSAGHPMTVEIVPRLGDDFVDATALSAAFELYVLADAGKDVIRTGAGDDFVNGAQDGDRVRGGPGQDWLRTGIGNDVISGGDGRDQLVGVEGHDTIHGGDGDDRVGGGPGNDALRGGAGQDYVLCGTGRDDAQLDRADTARDCESRKYG